MSMSQREPSKRPSRRALLLGLPAALLALRLPAALADEVGTEGTPAQPAPPRRELATFALG